MKTLLNWLAILTLFGGWVAVIASRYEAERVVEVERGMNPFATLLIGIVMMVAVSFLANNFKGKIYKDPFGKFAVTIYAVAFLAISTFIYFVINSIAKAADQNVAVFTENMAYHADTVFYLIMVSVVSLALAWSTWLYALIKK